MTKKQSVECRPRNRFILCYYSTTNSVNAEIARDGGYYSVQGHTKSPILVPSERGLPISE